jgi:hypothetical protein
MMIGGMVFLPPQWSRRGAREAECFVGQPARNKLACEIPDCHQLAR